MCGGGGSAWVGLALRGRRVGLRVLCSRPGDASPESNNHLRPTSASSRGSTDVTRQGRVHATETCLHPMLLHVPHALACTLASVPACAQPALPGSHPLQACCARPRWRTLARSAPPDGFEGQRCLQGQAGGGRGCQERVGSRSVRGASCMWACTACAGSERPWGPGSNSAERQSSMHGVMRASGGMRASPAGSGGSSAGPRASGPPPARLSRPPESSLSAGSNSAESEFAYSLNKRAAAPHACAGKQTM